MQPRPLACARPMRAQQDAFTPQRVRQARGRLLPTAFLPLMAVPAAVPKVGLLTITVRTSADRDRLLKLQNTRPQCSRPPLYMDRVWPSLHCLNFAAR